MIFLCFGDSLTAGWPGYYPDADGYSIGNGNIESQYEYWLKKFCVDYLEQEHGFERKAIEEKLRFINKGIPGDTSSGLILRSQDLIGHRPKPDYSIIIIGTNDLGWASKIEKIIANVKQIHELSRESGIISIGGGIPPVTKRASSPRWDVLRLDFNDQIEDYFREKDIPYTTYSQMTDEEGYLFLDCTSGDGVHFSVEGYKRMGLSLFKDVFQKLLDENIEALRRE
jgi:lysophospholipase L1-like esterase